MIIQQNESKDLARFFHSALLLSLLLLGRLFRKINFSIVLQWQSLDLFNSRIFEISSKNKICSL